MGLVETNRNSREYGHMETMLIGPTMDGTLRWRRSGTRWITHKKMAVHYRIYVTREGLVWRAKDVSRRFRYIFPMSPDTRGRLLEAIVFNQQDKEGDNNE